MFLNLLTARITSHDDEPAEFQIDDTYSVPVRTSTLYKLYKSFFSNIQDYL